MILTSDGEVLTNNHVVAGASSVTVTLFGQSDALPARVIGTDPTQDLALVQIENAARAADRASSATRTAAQVGDDVLAIGNALALSGGLTVTEGIVSSKNRSLTATSEITGRSENLTGLLQTERRHQLGQLGRPARQLLGSGDRHEHRGGREHPGQRAGAEHRVRDRHRHDQAAARPAALGRELELGPDGPGPAPSRRAVR